MSMYVTLPSNASWKEFPDNTNSDYKTRLSRPLALEGGEWEVGLTDVQFNNTWRNIDEGEFSLNYFNKQKDGPDRSDMKIIKGRYFSVREVVHAIQQRIRNEGLQATVSVIYDAVQNRVLVNLNKGDGPLDSPPFMVMSEDLGEILGYPLRTAIYGVQTIGTTPDIHRGMTSLYVYSDVVKERPVGDVLAPLLRVVPIVGTRNEVNYHEFSTVHYQPVTNYSSELIRVKIARDNGRDIRFFGGKVVVNLHFRKRKKTT